MTSSKNPTPEEIQRAVAELKAAGIYVHQGHKGDCNIVQVIVIFVGSFAMVGIVGIIVFLTVAILKEKPLGESVALLGSLGTLAGTAIGSLGSMLNQTNRSNVGTEQNPSVTTIANPPTDPGPVAQQPADE